MLLIECPWCGRCEQSEFHYGGEAHLTRATSASDNTELTEFLFLRNNVRGDTAERWFHATGCRRWFNAVRNTVDDRFICTYKPGDTATQGTTDA
ncbi:sarcosine oxidase subunit delta [Aliamphritea ceti]|uniref:sarcosine oxidase subunit delta n=1 Tax=Aliamphritea ceti TaxID=1524258 RepID=UPI0021C49F06|nr:sarcosine oxidase subunit delta [Aliamphritea ceti]